MAEVYVPIPDSQLTSATPTMVKGYQFSCNKMASYAHTAVGSGQWGRKGGREGRKEGRKGGEREGGREGGGKRRLR